MLKYRAPNHVIETNNRSSNDTVVTAEVITLVAKSIGLRERKGQKLLRQLILTIWMSRLGYPTHDDSQGDVELIFYRESAISFFFAGLNRSTTGAHMSDFECFSLREIAPLHSSSPRVLLHARGMNRSDDANPVVSSRARVAINADRCPRGSHTSYVISQFGESPGHRAGTRQTLARRRVAPSNRSCCVCIVALCVKERRLS